MQLDPNTARQLGFDKIRKQLEQYSQTPLGKAACRSLLPQANLERIQAFQSRIREIKRLADDGSLPPALDVALEVEAALMRAKKGGVLEGETIRQVARALISTSALRGYLLSEGGRVGKVLVELAKSMHDLKAPGRDFLAAFDDDGGLRDSASAELGSLRKSAAGLAGHIRQRLEALMQKRHVAACLRESYITQRGDRYVLPVRSDSHGQPFSGIVHDTSQSGATLFVEPAELVEDGNRLKLQQAKVMEEERRILAEYSAEIGNLQAALADNLKQAALFDFSFAAYQLGFALKGTLLEVGKPGLHLEKARHPLMVLAHSPTVPNDVFLESEHKGLIVTGPNAGGKTVALKTVGLICLMAQAGLPVPVSEGSWLEGFEAIHAVIGDAQDIQQGLSTFSAHLKAISEILDSASEKTLVLLDEITADTDPAHGAALARALLEAFAKRGTRLIVTTHFEELKRLAYENPSFKNASVGFTLEKMEPTYRLHPDIPGRSLTLDIARRLGVDQAILEQAESYLKDSEQKLEKVLSVLEEETQQVVILREELEAKQAELTGLLSEQKQAREEYRAARKDLFEKERDRLGRQLGELRKEAATVIEKLKKSSSMREAVSGSTRLKKIQEQIGQAVLDPDGSSSKETDLASTSTPFQDGCAFKPGDRVKVVSLGKIGEITAIDPRTGWVTLRLGSLRTRVAFEQIVLIPSNPASKAESTASNPPPEFKESNVKGLETRTVDNTLDLRGFRVDDALYELEKFLDSMFEREKVSVYVVHGHGTGALRSAVREHLARSPYVEHFRAGLLEEGGDGLTVVKLK